MMLYVCITINGTNDSEGWQNSGTRGSSYSSVDFGRLRSSSVPPRAFARCIAAAPYGLACGSYLRGSSFRNPMMMNIADGRRNCYWDAGNSSCESAATGASSRRFCPCEKEPLKYRCELQSAGLPSCVESPDGLDIETCESICGPAPLYHCIGDTCIPSEGGVDLGTCLSVCGDHNSTGH